MGGMKPAYLALPLLALLTACGGTPPEDLFSIDCQTVIKGRLKAPATAEFSPSYQQVQETGGVYRWAGHVDSQNSFGANIRTAFTCTGVPERVSVSLY